MKNILKMTIAAAALFVACGLANDASAQKMGYVNSQELVFALPEIKDVEAKMKTLQEEKTRQLEEMQVERNRKMDEYQKSAATLTDEVRESRQAEIDELAQRIQTRYTAAREEMGVQEEKLMMPLIEKARLAVEAVMKAQGLAGVLEASSLVTVDDALMVNVTPLAKKHLGIAE